MRKTVLIALFATFSLNAQTVTDYVTGLGVPSGIAFDASGNLFVADYNGYKVTKITPSLLQSTFVSSLNGTPQQIAFDANNNLWIAGSGIISEIEKVNQAGVVTTYPATASPYGIAVDASGNIYYSEANSGKIIKRTQAGVKTTFAIGLTQPNGMTFDSSGNLIVADKINDRVNKIAPDGTVSILISSITNPTNLVYAPNGDLYISNGYLNRIFRFPAGGIDGDQVQYVRFNTNYDDAGHMAIYNGELYVSTGSSTKKILKVTLPTSLGIEQNTFSKNNLLILPNPANEFVSIKNLSLNTKQIELFDMNGKLMKVYNNSEIKDEKLILPKLNAGNYILKVDDFSKVIIIK